MHVNLLSQKLALTMSVGTVIFGLVIQACSPGTTGHGELGYGGPTLDRSSPTGTPVTTISGTSPSTSASQRSGGIDGGGGNGMVDKMIETFRRYPTKDPVFQARLAPMIQSLQKSLPHFGNSLSYIAEIEPWYFIPNAPHEVIPSERLGVAFPTEQYGYQTLREIFVDNRVASQMSDEALADLYAHELVMAVYILPFSPNTHECEAESYYPGTSSQTGPWRTFCLGESPKPLKPIRELTDTDYQNVRFMAKYLQDPEHLKNSQDIAISLYTHGFRKYEFQAAINQEAPSWAPRQIESLARVLLTSQIMKVLPKITGETRDHEKIFGECHLQVDFNEASHTIHLKRVITKPGSSNQIGKTDDMELHGDDLAGNLKPLLFDNGWESYVEYELADGPFNPKPGDERNQVWIRINQNGMTNVHYERATYIHRLNDPYETYFNWIPNLESSPKNGPWFNYCAATPNRGVW